MAHCINKELPEVKKLIEESGLNTELVLARISIFQDKNGLESFPTVEDIISKPENSKLSKLEGSKKNVLDFSENIITDTISDILEPTDFSAEHNLLLFNNKQGKFTVDEILNNILSNSTDLSPKGRELLEKARRLVGRTGSKFQLVSESALSAKDTMMQIATDSNTIQISKDRIRNISTKDVVEGFIHEVAHAQTIQALVNPQTFEEREFKDFIEKYYNKFKSSTLSDSYGFINTKEFVAEIYASSDFRRELKAVDLKDKSNLWKQFLDNLRRLFGLTSSQENKNVIEQVVNFVEQDRRDYRGMNLQRLIFESKIPGSKKNKIESIEDRLTRTLNKAKDNLDQLLKRSKSYKKSNPIKGAKFEQHIKELISEINKVDILNQWKGVAIYVKSMNSTVSQLSEKLHNEDFTQNNGLEIIELYKSYLSSYDLIKDVTKLVTDLDSDKIDEIGREDIDEIRKNITEAAGKHNLLESDFDSKLGHILKTQLNDIKYLPQIEDKWRKRLSKEYTDRKLNHIDKESWISQQMETTFKDEIQKDLDGEINNLMSGIGTDISSAAVNFLDGINNNSKLVGIIMNLFTQSRNKIIEQTREGDFKDKDLFDNLVKEKGTSIPSKLYANILEYDTNGKAYYKGEYSLKFRDELKKFKSAKEIAYTEKGGNSKEYLKAKEAYVKFIKENTIVVKGVSIPIAKWKNDMSKLSKTEITVLNHFIQDTRTTDEQTLGRNTLIKSFRGINYYNLPSVTKSDTERVLEGNLKGMIKDKIADITSIRPDDIGYEERKLDGKGDPVYGLRVHYRGELAPDQQSLDLFTINRLNRINGINFKEKQNIQLQVEAIKNVAKNKEYYLKNSGGKSILNRFATREKEATFTGNSNEYKMISNMIEKNLYDIFHINYPNLGPIDVNKVISTANGWVASVGLSLNTFSAAANVINGQAQIFLEKVAGNHLTKGSVRKAHSIYSKDFANIAGDYGRPVKQSFVNQVNQMFDTFGGFTVEQQAFIKNSIAKTAISFESLQFMHTGGEHYLQSVMVMATLDSIKVMNENSEYIDREDKVTTKDKAASILDMLAKDDNGYVRLSNKVVYSDRNYNTKLNEGGKEQILLFVKKKLFDTMGNYDSNLQPEAYRHWWGKIILLFRRYLIPMAYNRFRGITKALVSEDKLTEDDIHFSTALRTTEEGAYVSTIRFIRHGIIPALTQLKFDIISSNWNELSDDKKAGIKKSIIELALTSAVLPLIGMMAAGAAGGNDDKDYLWTVAFLARRLESDLSQFRDPREATKITKSPIPGLRIVEQSLDVLEYILPWHWTEVDDRYKAGKNKGDLKFNRKLEKLAPVLSKLDLTSEELYQGLNSRWGR